MRNVTKLSKLLIISLLLVSCEVKTGSKFARFSNDFETIVIHPENQDKYFFEMSNGELIDVAYARHLIEELEYKLENDPNQIKYYNNYDL